MKRNYDYQITCEFRKDCEYMLRDLLRSCAGTYLRIVCLQLPYIKYWVALFRIA